MDYEKAYKELVGKIKNAHLYALTDSTKNVLENILPELAESKDEKIRKALIALVKCNERSGYTLLNNVSTSSMIAWLEKQKTQIDNPCTDCVNRKGCINCENGELREIEQKPVWSEEDEEMFQSVMIDCFYCGDFPDYPTREEQELYDEAMDKINWLKSLKNRVGCEANFTTAKEWNEEDEHRIKDTIYFLDTAKKHYASTEELDACIDWLKSLRPQNTYNPYKAVVESIAEMCKHYDKASHSGLRDFYDNVKVKCKDAKEYDKMFPKSHWKPNEEQLEFLQKCIKAYNEVTFPTEVRVLSSLYHDLKKLKEGRV